MWNSFCELVGDVTIAAFTFIGYFIFMLAGLLGIVSFVRPGIAEGFFLFMFLNLPMGFWVVSRILTGSHEKPAKWVRLIFPIGVVVAVIGVSGIGFSGIRRKTDGERVRQLWRLDQDLRAACVPTPAVEKFITQSAKPSLAQVQRLAACVTTITTRHQYVADKTDKVLPPSEFLKSFTGDCEDVAAATCAVARQLNYTARVCVGRSRRDKGVGHAWTEIRLCATNAMTPGLQEKIARLFGKSVSCVKKEDGWWLRVAQAGALDDYDEIWSTDLDTSLPVALGK